MFINIGNQQQGIPVASVEIVIPYTSIVFLSFGILVSITLAVFIGTSIATRK